MEVSALPGNGNEVAKHFRWQSAKNRQFTQIPSHLDSSSYLGMVADHRRSAGQRKLGRPLDSDLREYEYQSKRILRPRHLPLAGFEVIIVGRFCSDHRGPWLVPIGQLPYPLRF